ncbi:MAG TPA: CBS domain-containing protein [Gemmatirosa sp.]|jgi:CBS domain-containing protein|nr:CBS domain-containing protein [Gemmatirosa sp.]
MNLSDFVTADRVVVPLAGETLRAAGRVLLERLVAAGAVSHPERLRARAAEERPEDLVGMGDRAFLLHYRSDAVRELAVALGVAAAPVERELGESDETQSARIVLLIAAPPRHAALYLQVVGAFARLLSKPEVVQQVLAQPHAEALAALPAFAQFTLRDQLAVRDLMTERPRSVSPETPLRDAALDMVRAGVAGLPVVDGEGRVLGMLSQRELLQHLLTKYLQRGGPTAVPGTPPKMVRDVMTRAVLCVSPEQPVAEVAAMMTNKDVDRVPVVREGRLVGFLTRGDIVRKLIGS